MPLPGAMFSLTWRSATSASVLRRTPTSLLRPCAVSRTSLLTPVRTAHHQKLRNPPRRASQDTHQSPLSARLNRLLYLWRTSSLFRTGVICAGGAGGVFYITNLEVVPGSGRRRFNCISPETERGLAKSSLAAILREHQGDILPEWAPETRMVNRVLERLIPNSGVQDGDQWEVRVVRDSEANAFVLPGNKVFVNTGILPICENDDGLAAVLGHEISHNIAHHSAENLSRYGIFLLGIAVVASVTGFELNTSAWLLDYIYNKPGSRKQEREADYLGLLMMAKSCYNPEEAARLWLRMQQLHGRGIPQIMSTHPSDQSRIENMMKWMPEARQVRDMSECGFTIGYANSFRDAVAGFEQP